jgi:DNA replicative helicase MCM subunit Mcm2 (Cdc46/Mcm family)
VNKAKALEASLALVRAQARARLSSRTEAQQARETIRRQQAHITNCAVELRVGELDLGHGGVL